MRVMDEWVKALHAELAGLLPSGWRDATPWGYPQQSELAVLAAVYGAQILPAGVAEVVDHYMRARPRLMLDDLRAIASATVADLAEAVGPRWGETTVLGVPVRRVAVVHDIAVALVAEGIVTAKQFREAVAEREDHFERLMLGIRGLGPGTWESLAFEMHAKIRPNAQVVELVYRALGDSAVELRAGDIDELMRRTARRFAVDQRVLEHALDQYFDARVR